MTERAWRIVRIGLILAAPLLVWHAIMDRYDLSPGPIMGAPAGEEGKWKIVYQK